MTPGSGFLLIYIDNQSIGKVVWFDNLLVTQYSSDVLEEDHYYPFGLTMNINAAQVEAQKNPYKLTTKELESKFDLNMYDFGARMQDMQLGRWWSVDPLAEKYYKMSPYNYCGNNPVLFVDPDGMQIGEGKEYFDRFKSATKSKLQDANKRVEKFKKLANEAREKKDEKSAKKYEQKGLDAQNDVTALTNISSSLKQIEESDAIYDIFTDQQSDPSGNDAGGKTFYSLTTGHVTVSIYNEYSDQKIAHELAHVFQFDNGELSFYDHQEGGGFLYDITDEVGAYQWGAYFGGIVKNIEDLRKTRNYRGVSEFPASYNTPLSPYGPMTYLERMQIENKRNKVNQHIYHIPEKQ